MTALTSVEVFPSILKSRAFDVAWRVASDDIPASDILFMVEWAERESGPWIAAMDEPVRGATEIEGVGSPLLSASPSGFVRVVASAPNGDVLQASPAFTYGPSMSKRDFLEYRDALRRENLALSKFTGVPTRIFHRPSLGCRCPDCSDPILGGTMDSHCPTCLGTGLAQGYFRPVEAMVDWSAEARGTGTRTVESHGVEEKEERTARMMPFPSLASRDLFIMGSNNSVWEVVAVVPVTWKVWPVARRVSLRLLPKGDPAMKLVERGIG